jgi:hypothetical protein
MSLVVFLLSRFPAFPLPRRIHHPQHHWPRPPLRNGVERADFYEQTQVGGGEAGTGSEIEYAGKRAVPRSEHPLHRICRQSLDELEPDPDLPPPADAAEITGVNVGWEHLESHAHGFRHIGKRLIVPPAIRQHRCHELRRMICPEGAGVLGDLDV